MARDLHWLFRFIKQVMNKFNILFSKYKFLKEIIFSRCIWRGWSIRRRTWIRMSRIGWLQVWNRRHHRSRSLSCRLNVVLRLNNWILRHEMLLRILSWSVLWNLNVLCRTGWMLVNLMMFRVYVLYLNLVEVGWVVKSSVGLSVRMMCYLYLRV